MKAIVTILIFVFTVQSISAQKTNPNYDAALAKKLGADDYGMKYYVLVILKTAENAPENKDLRAKSFAGHMKNIKRLVDQGQLILAGPLEQNQLSYRGIFILNVSDLEAAEELLQTDPAIENGFLDTELFKWYGSAALPEYLETSDKIWKLGF